MYPLDSTHIPTMCQVLRRPPVVGLGMHDDICDSKAFGVPTTLRRKVMRLVRPYPTYQISLFRFLDKAPQSCTCLACPCHRLNVDSPLPHSQTSFPQHPEIPVHSLETSGTPYHNPPPLLLHDDQPTPSNAGATSSKMICATHAKQ